MEGWFNLVGPDGELEIAGVRLVGVTLDNGKKLLLTLLFGTAVLCLLLLVRRLLRLIFGGGEKRRRLAFWIEQSVTILVTGVVILGLLSIWFNEPSRLATFMGLVSAGVAFALQKVITAFAGYFIILRGKMFNVGDRITMGGVRGDVIDVGFFQTRIMEMGQPSDLQQSDASTWVLGRQYTGRIVAVTNDKIFEQPVYNYTHEFPYIWDEIRLPINYKADRTRAEEILLEAVRQHTVQIRDMGEDALKELQRRYYMKREELGPRVYYRLTDNWLEMTVRFIALDHQIRDLKDRVSREILKEFDAAGIGIASSTYDIVGMPPLHIVQEAKNGAPDAGYDAVPAGHKTRPR